MARGSLFINIKKVAAVAVAVAFFICPAATVYAKNEDSDNADKLYARNGDICTYITKDKFLYNYKGDSPGLTICGYVGESDKLKIPNMINGRDVTAIEADSFVNDDSIVSVELSDNIKEIGQNCFNGCKKLKNLTLKGNVYEFRNVFCDCPSLDSLVFPLGVGSIIGSFKDCTSLTYVRFSRSVTNLDEDSFNGCTSLQTIEWLGGIIKINNAFDNCTSLESVEIPNSVIQIDGAFDGCTSLSEITFPDSLLYITGGFSDCESLTGLTLPGKLLFVTESFNGCKNLAKLRSSESTTISNTSFTGCPKLTMERESDILWRVLGWLALIALSVAVGLLIFRVLDAKAKEIERLKAREQKRKTMQQ